MYKEDIERKVKVAYSIANEARSKGFDPISKVEIPVATDLPERVTGLISTVIPQIKDKRIEQRIRDLEAEHGFLHPVVAFLIADEIASEKYSKFDSKLAAIEAGSRVGFAYLTMGSVSSPLEGFTRINLKENEDGQYFSVFFSGPIRSAGGTAASVGVVLVDYLRERFGYSKHKAKEDEVNRAATEVYDYHDRITNLQYLPTEEEVLFLARNLPVQLNGDPSEDLEVSNYKMIEAAGTPRLRGGYCLVMAECIPQKAAKLMGIVDKLRAKGLKLKDWDFLRDLVSIQKKRKSSGSSKEAVYIKDIVAGRPVFGHPSRNGSFRLRYGRTRVSGLSCTAIHPATSYILKEFIAVGTQLRMEKPGKSAAITFCDSIEPAIVKLDDGRVVKVDSIEQAKKISRNLQEVLYLGDMLISYGDFFNRNHPLLPCGYNEEYWQREIEQKNLESDFEISLEESIKISEENKVALNPKYIFYWNSIDLFSIRDLLKWMLFARIDDEIILPISGQEEAKRALELIGCQHLVISDKVVINSDANALLYNLGLLGLTSEERKKKINETLKKFDSSASNTLEVINSLCGSKIRDKGGTFIGSRMGRPEKAKPRKLTGQPNVLFPVGNQGGRLRSFNEASKQGKVVADFPIYFCEDCETETVYPVCERCKNQAKKMAFCKECEQRVDGTCSKHNVGFEYISKPIDINHYLNSAKEKLNFTDIEMPNLIKGVRGTSSASHTVEHLAKGILRAAYGLSVNKDGTIRADMTELPITHFKPGEVGTSIEKLKELGYTKDLDGNDLVDKEQVLELKPQDVVLPMCPESLEQRIDELFVKSANFIDNLLARLYDLKPFYDIKSKEDLVGHLVVALSPHTSVGVVGRIVGFSGIQALYAHPLMHAALRRDADGDEAALMLLLDCLINFSHKYLPAHRGATQDAPLILNTQIKATEVDDMAFDIEIVDKYPLEFYTSAEQQKFPREIKIKQIDDLLGGEIEGIRYTHEISSINMGVTCSAYKRLETMGDKVDCQMEVASKVRAVDSGDVARLVIERHFIRDIRGNLRKFSSQQFRCSKCNSKYRRPPLVGKCIKCGGNIIFTISEGGIVKYLESALKLAENYEVSSYVSQGLELVKRRIESIFGREKEKQTGISEWMG